MRFVKFNPATFFIAVIVCGVLTFVSLIAAAAIDEGTGGTGLITMALGKLFNIFRFPTHTLFFHFMNGSMFLVGLFVNSLFYALIVERVASFYKTRKP